MILGALTMNLDDDDPDFIALWLANNIFGASANSRLFQRIRGKDGLSYGVGSSYNAATQEKFGQIVFRAIANPQNAAKVEAAFKEELTRALKDGFTADEVEAAKKQFAQDNSVQMSQDAFCGQYAGALHPIRPLTDPVKRHSRKGQSHDSRAGERRV